MLRRLGGWLAVVGIVALFSAVTTAAPAGPPGQWTRVTATNLVNFAEPAMARTADGVLHFVYHHPTGPLSEELVHSAISPAGALAAGSNVVVAPAWTTLNQRPALVRTPDGGLRLFFAGLHSTVTGDPLNEDLMTITSGADGRSWGAPQPVGTGNVPSYASFGIAAAVARDGNFVVAEGDPGNLFHFGIGGGPSFAFETRGCCVYDPGLGVDSVSGEVVLGWFSLVNGNHGLWTQTISPTGLAGPLRAAPGSAGGPNQAVQPLNRTPLTGRMGAPGVYLAYGSGYPSFGTVNLLRVGGSPQVVARAGGLGASNVGIAPAPEGRLWLMWQVGTRYLATRSNKAATRFGPVTRLTPPAGTGSTFGLWGEGSLGRLDLLAHTGTVANAVSFWHTQVLPPLDVSAPKAVAIAAKAGAKATVTIKVADVGDPVPGVRVTFAGQTKPTNLQGVATFTVRRSGKFKAAAQRAGYRPDTTQVTARKKKRR